MFSHFGLKQFVPLTLSALTFASAAFGATAYINQVGYRPSDSKEFTLEGGEGSVEIVDKDGKTVLTAEPSGASIWNAYNKQVQRVDFSELKTPGTYSIKVNGTVVREDLVIAENTFEEVAKASLKWFYYQRASMELEETYAGKWKRPAGHTKSTATLHSSTGASGNWETSKGWYDAGDYGRYIVNSGISTYTLLSLYEHYPDYFKTLKWNIPAEGKLPDLLTEIKYNLDWMLTMQAEDGGVYHKLSTLNFPGEVMPIDDTEPLYVIGKGTAATFDFAAVMATAYRVYKPFDEEFANKCLEAAKKAYEWADMNPNVRYSNPSDVKTGEYGDRDFDDETVFAVTELYVSTGDTKYKQSYAMGGIPSWADVSGLALYGEVTHGKEFDNVASKALSIILKKADDFVSRSNTGFGVVMDKGDFVWGSNAVAANQGVWLLHAYYITGEQKYYDAARKVLDYLLGKNPLDMSFISGYGTKSPKYPHHRPSTADGIAEPVPGMLAGGPQPGGQDIGQGCPDYRTGQAATSYVDNRCSYASNEVAINWNAPFAYLAGAIEAINAGHKPKFEKVELPAETTALSKIRGPIKLSDSPRMIFDGHRVMMKMGDKKFDLNGTRLVK